jgi:hypothetical protein
VTKNCRPRGAGSLKGTVRFGKGRHTPNAEARVDGYDQQLVDALRTAAVAYGLTLSGDGGRRTALWPLAAAGRQGGEVDGLTGGLGNELG